MKVKCLPCRVEHQRQECEKRSGNDKLPITHPGRWPSLWPQLMLANMETPRARKNSVPCSKHGG